MQPDASSPQAAAAVAALVPRLLDLHPEPAAIACELALADTIERAAEHLLRWSDALVGVASGLTPVRAEDQPSPASEGQDLSRAVRTGELPGNIPSVEWAGRELCGIAAVLRDVLAEVRPHDRRVADAGRHIAEDLERLAEALTTHAGSMRKLSFDLAHLPADGAGDTPDDERNARRDQVLAQATRAEHALARVAVATLPG